MSDRNIPPVRGDLRHRRRICAGVCAGDQGQDPGGDRDPLHDGGDERARARIQGGPGTPAVDGQRGGGGAQSQRRSHGVHAHLLTRSNHLEQPCWCLISELQCLYASGTRNVL